MEQEVLQRLYDQSYRSSMTFDAYLSEVSLGLQLIKSSTLNPALGSNRSINMALEYNLELMLNYWDN
jgi:hypothetical protein